MNKVVTFGEIMLRLSPPDYQRFVQASAFDATYGGSEANVALSLAQYGLQTQFVSRLPKNAIAERALLYLQQYGVDTKEVIRGGQRLGLYYLERGAAHRASNVIYDRSHSAISTIETGIIDWEKIFDDADWFHWSGITPAISQQAADVCGEALAAANKLGITVSTDLNYRSKLWEYGEHPNEVMPNLVKRCDIIHAGIHASNQYFDISVKETSNPNPVEQHRRLAIKLLEKFPRLTLVTATLRKTVNVSNNKLTGLLFDGDNLYTSPEYVLSPIIDRVGAGDAFMAGIIYRLLTNPDNKQLAVDFAAAASALKHTIPGDANISSVEEVEQLMKGTSAGTVSR